jgi:urease accessory protein
VDAIGPAAAGVTLAPAPAAPAARVGRDGRLTLRFERRGARTVLTRCRSALPLQVLVPVALPDVAAVVSVLNPTGGLVGGDRLAIEVSVGAGAHACLTTPAATKVYRTTGAAAEQDVWLSVERDAVLEWVPDHTIPFAGSVLRQQVHAEVADGARLILLDAFAAGRVARGEAWRFRRLESALGVRDRQGWLVHDRFVLRGGPRWDGVGFAEGNPYFATVVVIAEGGGLEAFRSEVVAIGAGRANARVGVGLLPRRGAIVRLLAPSAPALIETLDSLWTTARCTILGLPRLGLRKL